MPSFNLPKPYLSKSQIASWTKSREEYKRTYFLGEKRAPTAEMRFGSAAEREETQTQTEIKADLNGLQLFGIMDAFSENLQIVRDDKTGKVAWDEKRLLESWDFKFYSVAVFQKYGFIPNFEIFWEETAGKGNQIVFTGHCETFSARATEAEIAEFSAEIIRIAGEISAAFTEFQKSGSVSDSNEQVEFLAEKISNAKKMLAESEAELKSVCESEQIEKYKSDLITIYPTTRKKWEYPESVVSAEAEAKRLKKAAESDGTATFTESTSLTFKIS